MTVEDNRMFPVQIIDEQGAKTNEYVRVFLKATYPSGEGLYEDEDGNLYASSRSDQQLGVVRIESEDDLPFQPAETPEGDENAAEVVPPATGYEVADEATGAYEKEREAEAARADSAQEEKGEAAGDLDPAAVAGLPDNESERVAEGSELPGDDD